MGKAINNQKVSHEAYDKEHARLMADRQEREQQMRITGNIRDRLVLPSNREPEREWTVIKIKDERTEKTCRDRKRTMEVAASICGMGKSVQRKSSTYGRKSAATVTMTKSGIPDMRKSGLTNGYASFWNTRLIERTDPNGHVTVFQGLKEAVDASVPAGAGLDVKDGLRSKIRRRLKKYDTSPDREGYCWKDVGRIKE